jgi:hypothetical protein
MFRAAVSTCGLLMLLPSAAAAQSPAADAVSVVYGISTGVGRRTVTGAFTSSEEPAGAEGGAAFGDSHGWGSLAAHAVVRGWVTTHVWIEGGWGLAELAFRPPSLPGTAPSRWWAPGGEAAGGFDVFQGPSVSVNLFVRYSEARFDAVRQQTVSIQIGLFGRY